MRIHSSFQGVVQNTVMLYGLSVAKIVFPLITLPYLTRVLSVDCYGTVAYVKNVMQYMQLIIDFGFMLSATRDVVLAKKEDKPLGEIVGDVFGAQVLLSLCSIVALSVMGMTIKILRNNVFYLGIAYIPVLLTVFLFDYLFRGIERMGIITIRFIVMRGIATVMTFLLVHNDKDILWIPILDSIGTMVAVILVNVEIKKLKINVQFTSIHRSIEKLKESFTYFASNFATTAFGALNTLLIGIFLPVGDVAYWSVCEQLIGGAQMLYNPVVNGIYPEMIKRKSIALIKKVLKVFLPVVITGCLLSFALSHKILTIVGGPPFIAAVSTFRLLIPVLLFSFPAMVLGWPMLGAIEKAKQVTRTTVLAALYQVLGLGVLIVINRFSLCTLALLRSSTEMVLMVLRLGCYLKYRTVFKRD